MKKILLKILLKFILIDAQKENYDEYFHDPKMYYNNVRKCRPSLVLNIFCEKLKINFFF